MVISVHDIMPEWESEVDEIFRTVRSVVGSNVSAAVVPSRFSHRSSRRLIQTVSKECAEITLHGFDHRAGCSWHPLTIITGGANEFSGLSLSAAHARLQAGQSVLSRLFGQRAEVFVPPGWAMGPVSPQLLQNCGIRLCAGLMKLRTTSGSHRLSVCSWDCGILPAMGYLGEFFGRAASIAGRGTPVIVLHPVDVRRGFLPRAIRRLESLLAEGYQPTTFSALGEKFQH